MQPYVVITRLPSEHSSSRGGHPIRGVVLHATDSPAQSSPESTLTFLRRNSRQVSAHEFLTPPDPETNAMIVYRLVPDERAAHAVGFSQFPGFSGNANLVTWSIEIFRHRSDLNQPWPQDLYTVAIERLALACQRHGLGADAVFMHREIDTQGKTCPGMAVDADQVRADVEDWLNSQTLSDEDRIASLRRGLQELNQEVQAKVEALLTV